MTWRCLTTRDPVLLKNAAQAPDWLPPGMDLHARVVAIMSAEADAPIVVQLARPSTIGFDQYVGLHLALADAGTWWSETSVVEVRRFRFPPDSPNLREGVTSSSIEGRLTYERRPFDFGDVFAEAQEGGGSRMISSAELSLLVEYARARDAAVTNVEAYELRDVLEVPRIDLGIYGLDESDEGMTDPQRLERAAGNVSEVLALAEAEGHRFGYRVWAG